MGMTVLMQPGILEPLHCSESVDNPDGHPAPNRLLLIAFLYHKDPMAWWPPAWIF